MTVEQDYDRIAAAYAVNIADELAGKPADRAVLDAFAARWAGRGTVAEIGCGPAQVASHLTARGVAMLGMDISAAMLAEAHRLHPGLALEQADFSALGARPGRFVAIVAFYALVHLEDPALGEALRAIRLAVAPGGELLAAVHIGEGWLHPATMWDVPVALGFRLFAEGAFEAALEQAGFTLRERWLRDPYEGVEHPTRRLMVSALA